MITNLIKRKEAKEFDLLDAPGAALSALRNLDWLDPCSLLRFSHLQNFLGVPHFIA